MIAILKKKVPAADQQVVWGNKLITFLNPYSYLLARKQRDLFGKMDEIHIDGISLVLLLKLAGISSTRRSFDMTSMAKELFAQCEESGQSIYFIGAKTHEVQKSVQHFLGSYPNLNVAGFRDGYIKNEWQTAVAKVVKIAPDFVVVGMGTPLQEQFLVDLRLAGFKGGGFTCGGFLHQSAGGSQYYPKWANRLHLRWLYRIFDEPKLFTRYAIQYPISALVLLGDIFRGK